MADATITEISDSSDLVWDIVCRYEDGKGWTRAEYLSLSDADKQILSEEVGTIINKNARLADHDALRREIENPRPAFRPAHRQGGPDYEKMILDADAADSSWWT